MDSSQRLLRLKIITGYVVLVLLFLLVLALYYREHGKLAVMDREAQSLLTRRGQTERIAVKLLDMALLGERIMAWDEEDYAEYKNKRERVTQSLLELRGTLPDTESRERIDSILALLAQKERYTFSVLNGLRELDDTYSLLQERIPDFVRQDSVLQERLNVRIGKDLEASDTFWDCSAAGRRTTSVRNAGFVKHCNSIRYLPGSYSARWPRKSLKSGCAGHRYYLRGSTHWI